MQGFKFLSKSLSVKESCFESRVLNLCQSRSVLVCTLVMDTACIHIEAPIPVSVICVKVKTRVLLG